jgi:hypothetical protein
MRLKTAQKQILQAEVQNRILYQKRVSMLLLERAWLKRQIVDILKKDAIAEDKSP